MLALAALLVGSNWLMFLWAVAHEQVVASSLGYFLTPLVNVLLGLDRPSRKSSTGWNGYRSASPSPAIANEIITLGSLPWVSLFLAATFGTYGLVRKQVPVDALSGLWLETLAMLPVCAIYALWMAQSGHLVFAIEATSTAAWLVGAGIITALPLMAFAAATQRLDLATVGMLMYINPTMQFATRHLDFRRTATDGAPRQFRADLARSGLLQRGACGKRFAPTRSRLSAGSPAGRCRFFPFS